MCALSVSIHPLIAIMREIVPSGKRRRLVYPAAEQERPVNGSPSDYSVRLWSQPPNAFIDTLGVAHDLPMICPRSTYDQAQHARKSRNE